MFTLLTTCALALGCRDTVGSDGYAPEFTEGAASTVAVVRCEGNAQTGALACVALDPNALSASRGPRKTIIGSPDVQLSSYNVLYDTTTLIFGFDAKVKNQLAEAIGTPNGTTVTGLKVYYESGPTATSYYSPGDTGTVTVNNEDGTGHFTKANQPFHFYNELVAPGDTTDRKRWELRMPRTVKTFSFQVRVFTARPSEVPVTSVSPRGFPDWVVDGTRLTDCTGEMPGQCIEKLVQIYFRSTATLEEKQAAIDAVRGQVVGGLGSSFVVEIFGDTTFATVRNALTVLRGLPQVREVFAVSGEQLVPEYLQPDDDTSWDVWELKSSQATGMNWALEMIEAPMAWGCSVGDATTGIAVIDRGFHSVTDLGHASSTGFQQIDAYHDTVDHGTRVAALAAGRGNNNAQVTGVMWNSNLLLYDASFANGQSHGGTGVHPWEVTQHIRRAGRDGASVINMSVGAPWSALKRKPVYPSAGYYNPDVVTHPDSIAANMAYMRSMYLNFREAADTLVAEGHDALLVFSAGNEPFDAKWSIARILADSVDNVLVVGATNHSGGFAFFSAKGSLVRIAAPGQNVGILRGTGAIDSLRGTGSSFSAPLVSGVAGLLKSFDPRLTADSILMLLVQGAKNGGRFATPSGASDSIPILNAYESLKLAAARPGAPICGNRVWVEQPSGRIIVQRSAVLDDSLPVSDAIMIGRINHGGRAIWCEFPKICRRSSLNSGVIQDH